MESKFASKDIDVILKEIEELYPIWPTREEEKQFILKINKLDEHQCRRLLLTAYFDLFNAEKTLRDNGFVQNLVKKWVK